MSTNFPSVSTRLEKARLSGKAGEVIEAEFSLPSLTPKDLVNFVPVLRIGKKF